MITPIEIFMHKFEELIPNQGKSRNYRRNKLTEG